MSRKVRQAADSGCGNGVGGLRASGADCDKGQALWSSEAVGGGGRADDGERAGGTGRRGRGAEACRLLHLVAAADSTHLDVLENEEEELPRRIVDDLEQAHDVLVTELLHDGHLAHDLRQRRRGRGEENVTSSKDRAL